MFFFLTVPPGDHEMNRIGFAGHDVMLTRSRRGFINLKPDAQGFYTAIVTGAVSSLDL